MNQQKAKKSSPGSGGGNPLVDQQLHSYDEWFKNYSGDQQHAGFPPGLWGALMAGAGTTATEKPGSSAIDAGGYPQQKMMLNAQASSFQPWEPMGNPWATAAGLGPPPPAPPPPPPLGPALRSQTCPEDRRPLTDSTPVAAGTGIAEGLTQTLKQISGCYVPRIEWRVENVKVKLKMCAGRPLVSPPFDSRGLNGMKLMLFPGGGADPEKDAAGQEKVEKAKKTREQKSKYEHMINFGPLHGALRLKCAAAPPGRTLLRFNLFIGGQERGPFTLDFKEHILQGCDDFGCNWLDQIDEEGSLSVGVELLDGEAKKRRGGGQNASQAQNAATTSPKLPDARGKEGNNKPRPPPGLEGAEGSD